ncbi:MAG: peptidylprolyl isomerase [Clostridiales bacterium]|nr:peptidylprolyl isomerase [Clostridiales bacterium]HCH68287.1 peptidylprolyl isomerase [Clostridiales bacterium]
MKRILSFLGLILSLSLLLSACGQTTDTDGLPNKIIIKIQEFGEIYAELYPEEAPITVANFKKLVNEHYYDGLTFHRVIKNFMIQGGKGTEVDSIKGEFSANGIQNDLKHLRGTLSMARATDYNSASAQFFICQRAYAYGDGYYAAFGKVTGGMEVVDRIASVETDSSDAPLTPVIIESITFDYGA